jgi:ribosome-associated protein
VVFNTEALTPLFERVIIASGTSNRQTRALASSVRETVKERGLAVLRTEGEDNGEWIIVDCGAAVAHIMQPAIRDYYHLEEIWGAKPVKLKGADGGGTPAAAARPASAGKAPAGKVSPKKTSAKTAPAKKASAKKAPARNAPAKDAPARKAPARKAPSPKPRKAAPAKAARSR